MAGEVGELGREAELRAALDNEEFALHFQPIVRLGDRAIVGFEALVRWLHPPAIQLPAAFLPEIERYGFMPRLGQWVIENAAASLRQIEMAVPRRNEPDGGSLFMSVNLSVSQLDDPDLLRAIERAVTVNRLAPGRLRLEVAEADLVDRLDDVARLSTSCAELGVQVAIDHFGTGANALSSLYRLPLAGVKLARTFAVDLATFPRSAEVLRALARFARQLSLGCVACGLEDYRQATLARDLGVEFGQGHFFGTAMPLLVASSFVRRSSERAYAEPQAMPLAAMVAGPNFRS